MKIERDERRFDFRDIGLAIKRAREAAGMTQEQLAYIVDRAPRTIMYNENDGQHPSLNTFYQMVTMFDISVDQYFYPSKNKGSECRKRIDAMLGFLDEKELKIVEATIQAMKAAKETEDAYDMYPLYWTPSRGGIIMRYTYEYKRKCVELYREGKWPETPEGVSDKSFRDKVRLWVRAEDSRGPEALKHKNFNRNWTPEERLELVSQVMSGKSCVSVAIEAGIQDRLLYQWVQNYKTKGYNGLVEMKKGRPSKGVPQMKKEEARPLNESEREELIRIRAENEYIKAENEVIKKEIALREERHAAQLKARKQRSSKSCVKKDTN